LSKSCRSFFIAAVLTACSGLCLAASKLAYPPTRITQTEDVYFKMHVKDPYRWLEEGRSPEVKAWVDAEDKLAREYLSRIPGRDALRARLKTLEDIDTYSVPKSEVRRLFYTRRSAAQQKPVLYLRDDKGHDQLLLDPMTLSPDGSLSLGDWAASPDGKKLAYLLKKNNADEAVLHVRNVEDGTEDPKDEIPGANFADTAWSHDSRGFYYMALPVDPKIAEADRVANAVIRFHRLGTPAASDAEVYPKTGDSSLYLSPHVSRDGTWLFVSVINGWTSNTVYARKEGMSGAAFQPVFVSTSSTASVTAWQDAFYINTNDHAPHYGIWKTDADHLGRAEWKPLIHERKDTTITAMQLIGGHLVLTTLKNAASQIEVWTLEGKLLRTLSLPGLGKIEMVSGRENADDVYYGFESFTLPEQIYQTSVTDGRSRVWAAAHAPVAPSRFTVDQVWFRSKDGTPVSMFVVQGSSRPRNGSTPFLIEGYGGFDEPMLPHYSAMIVSWLEAGGGYALPNLRGGGEYGEAWHQAGMLTHKQNTFDDFIAAAEYLIKEGYTRTDRLSIQGVSNGGLLVGAAVTQRPDLFRGAVCKVPLLDMVRYPLFGEGPAWLSEYGSPKKEDQFRALIEYSPYHHVREATAYPAVLLISQDQDDRVDPMHARKMAAALQTATSSPRPILLSTERRGGHSGSGMNNALLEDWTDRMSFLMSETGITGQTP
jgi:prolyl oligopeptidase